MIPRSFARVLTHSIYFWLNLPPPLPSSTITSLTALSKYLPNVMAVVEVLGYRYSRLLLFFIYTVTDSLTDRLSIMVTLPYGPGMAVGWGMPTAIRSSIRPPLVVELRNSLSADFRLR